MPKIKDLTNQKFGRLTVVEFAFRKYFHNYWKCKCDCGNEKIVRGYELIKGNTKSCGCYNTDFHTTHGMANTRLYRIWLNMIQRCNNERSMNYKRYGARGIKVCHEWEIDFMYFYNWAINTGYTDNLTLDRINNNGNYEPINCRWATKIEQERNKSTNVFAVYNKKRLTLSEISEITGIEYHTLFERYKNGDRNRRLVRPVKQYNIKNKQL